MKKEFRVIVVDDEVEERNLIKGFLEHDGYHIDLASDGYQAIELIKKNDYDIVIANYKMPDIDGIEIIRKAREIRTYIASLLITGLGTQGTQQGTQGTQEIVQDAFKEGDINNYLFKPFENTELRRLVKLSIHEQQIKKREDNLWQELMLKVKEATSECENKKRLLEKDQERIRKLNIQLKKLAITDGLTGLYNYRYFHKRLSEELSRAVRFNLSLSYIMIDIDYFKNINDMYGHQVGDEILQGLSIILKDSIRDIDIAARYGGEEFALILPQIDKEGAGIMAERLREKIESYFFSNCSKPINITVSIGVATYPGDGIKDGNDLLKRADDALYKAKHMGRNRVIIHSAKGDKYRLTFDKEKEEYLEEYLLEERLNELRIIDSAIIGIHRNAILNDPCEENLKLVIHSISQMTFNPVAGYLYDEVNDLLRGGVGGGITEKIKRSEISLSSLEREGLFLKMIRGRYISGIIDIRVVESPEDLFEGERKILKEIGMENTPFAILPFTGEEEERGKGIIMAAKKVMTINDINALRNLIAQVNLTIENLNLRAKNRGFSIELQEKNRKKTSEKKGERFTLIKEVGVKLNSAFKFSELDKVISDIMNKIIKILDANQISIYSYEEEKGLLELRTTSQDLGRYLRSRENIDYKDTPIMKYVIDRTLKEEIKKPILIEDVKKVRGIKQRMRTNSKGYMGVPLIVCNTFVGILNITDKIKEIDFTEEDIRLASILGRLFAVSIYNAQLYRRLERQALETIFILIKTIEAKDQYTKGHSERVSIYSVYIAEAMGLSHKEIEKVRTVAILHDIGKIGISENTLHKTGRLTKEEYDEVKRYPIDGVKMIGNWLKDIHTSVRSHHEREDGKGYPDGRSGNEIHQIAKIVNIADSFDAMMCKRPYRDKLPMCEILFEMIRCSGRQFDSKIIEVFIRRLTKESIEISEDGMVLSTINLGNHKKRDLIRMIRERSDNELNQDNRYTIDRNIAGHYIRILEGKGDVC
ncbi:MAG: diguanylate cyclase [Nitrospinae bacterium]|nr:diguanylate cyclase [Nitrospinota bacterium]